MMFFSKGPEDIGRTTLYSQKIETGDAPLIREPLRRTPIHRKEEAKKQLQEMLENGVIEPSKSAWASALLYVRKKNGTLGLCLDFRKLNDVTEHDSYPTRPIPSCIESLHGSKWFSSLDMTSGYWQVPMDPKDAHKTAFLTEDGLFQWRVCVFGLKNSGGHVQ
jgi:hypothetical protein